MSKKRRSQRPSPHSSKQVDQPPRRPDDRKIVSIPSRHNSLKWYRSPVVVIPALVFLICAIDHLWVTEDAFITFKSVENFWVGYGPQFNRGLRVESFSHPAWFIILVVLRSLGSESLPAAAAILGVALSLVGLIAGIESGRIRLQRASRIFPLGALIITALPPFWDFASSGLETGLTFAWIGLVALFLTRIAEPGSPTPSLRIFWLLGLAPLIRPDLAVMAVPFSVLAWLFSRVAGEGVLPSIKRAVALILPGSLWQLFRMGYYGLTVPNTYLAKEGFSTRWDQGFTYLNDLYGLYWLYPIVFAAIIATAVSSYSVTRKLSEPSSLFPTFALPGVFVVCGVIHTLVVCRTGGDFMHGRLLLPGLFAILTGASVVCLPTNPQTRNLMVIPLVIWMSIIMLMIRPPYRSKISSFGIADERTWYVHRSRTTRPISLEDYAYHHYYRIGQAVTEMVKRDNLSAVYWAHIGITVSAMPAYVTVIDPLALNDHIGSHITLSHRGRPGHEKIVRAAWFLARYPSGSGLVVRNQLDGVFEKRETPEAIAAAQKVLQSPPVAELTEAVSAPLTWNLFWKNVLRAPRLTRLRIPEDPFAALQGIDR